MATTIPPVCDICAWTDADDPGCCDDCSPARVATSFACTVSRLDRRPTVDPLDGLDEGEAYRLLIDDECYPARTPCRW
ncbi:MAG TPA: hypothetical protein VGM37_16135 [Armatimonadota bacterium]|jgi:hypothetical protein